MLKVLELFAGIGACSKALERLGIEHEIVDAVEIDKYAIKSFNAVHGTNFEPQDITKWDKDIECDLIMHGSPCQDFSVAGKQAGGDKDSGTRSSLMYETLRIVEKLKPKYVIWENVKNLLSKKHRHNFDAYLEAMSQLGYVSKYQVLNAKDYGIPQNRERVFTVSVRTDGNSDEYDAFEQDFHFPEKQELGIRLKDILEAEVDEKYYLSDEQVARFKASTFHQSNYDTIAQNKDSISGTLCARDYKDPKCVRVGGLYDKEGKKHQAGAVYDPNGIGATLSTMQGGNQEPIIVTSRGRGEPPQQQLEPRKDGLTNTITSVEKDNYVAIRTANKKGYDMAQDGDSVDLAYPDSETRIGRVGHGVSKTVTTGDTMGVMECRFYAQAKEATKKAEDGDIIDAYNQKVNKTGVSPTVTTRPEGFKTAILPVQQFRIRKLTPKECWRLMGFDDEDFEKAKAAGISNSQLYKQAGNSIVVNVLEGILRKLLQS